MNKRERQKMDAKQTPKCHPRGLARSVAHAKFVEKGFDNVDKKFMYKNHKFSSYFSTHWRSILNG